MRRHLKVLLGVGGGIAAIKAPELVRLLRQAGHQVRVALSPNAASFVAPLSLEVLSESAVWREEYLRATGSGREEHLELGRWADVCCVVPATAHLIASLSLGLADSFLTTTALVFDGPMLIAPAMSSEMWAKKVVQEHVRALESRGVIRVGPVRGLLANGETGDGRMAEPAEIRDAVERMCSTRDLAGRTVLVTAGPTREPLDPVRFLSNRSSGKMGFRLAEAAAARGAKVELVAGPVALETPVGVHRVDVETAREMQAAVDEVAPTADLIIMTAAVSDYRPVSVAAEKIKKRSGVPQLALEANPDILAGLARSDIAAVRVGFAAETADVETEATRKLEEKELDFVVANDVSRPGIGFGSDDNEVVVLAPGEPPERLPRLSKRELAHRLLDRFGPAIDRKERDVVGTPG